MVAKSHDMLSVARTALSPLDQASHVITPTLLLDQILNNHAMVGTLLKRLKSGYIMPSWSTESLGSFFLNFSSSSILIFCSSPRLTGALYSLSLSRQ